MRKSIILISLLLIVELYAPRLILAQEWLNQYNLVEDRFKTDLTLKASFGTLILSNRCRFEWQNFEADPRSRYKNRTQIEHPMRLFGQKFTPYVAAEFIYNVRQENFDEQRNVIGVSKKLGRHLKTSLFYTIKKTSSTSTDEDAHIIGAQFDILFD